VQHLSLTAVALLVVAAFAAGFVDAVVGGGGLIQLPALVIALPAVAPVQILATNKISSICGTTVAGATYYRRVQPRAKDFMPLMLSAFVGSMGGAVVATRLPRDAFDPIVLVALLLVGSYVLFRPDLGHLTSLRFTGWRHVAVAMAVGVVVGFYDGALGPGTGSFFVISLVGLLGYAFLDASARARFANWATNAAALVIFVPQGAVMWGLGLAMGASNLLGGYLGARTAVARGSGFVRILFIVVVGVLAVRLALRVTGVMP
jgi:hypothetical protein